MSLRSFCSSTASAIYVNSYESIKLDVISINIMICLMISRPYFICIHFWICWNSFQRYLIRFYRAGPSCVSIIQLFVKTNLEYLYRKEYVKEKRVLKMSLNIGIWVCLCFSKYWSLVRALSKSPPMVTVKARLFTGCHARVQLLPWTPSHQIDVAVGLYKIFKNITKNFESEKRFIFHYWKFPCP